VPFDKGISIAWQHVPHQEGGWASWDSSSEEDRRAYARLLAPDRKIFFVTGDQVSPVSGWQEGAVMSAEHVVEQIAGVRPLTVPAIKAAPDTKRLVIGE
jgi:monoamine oxidase